MNSAKKWAWTVKFFVHVSIAMMISSSFAVMFFAAMPQRTAAEGPWENIQSISKTMDIPPGQEYFVYLDSSSGSLVEMALPSPEAGLTQDARDALDQVPEWLYDDLAKKFAELGDTNIDAVDFSAPVFADMDGDGDLDLTVGSEAGPIFHFENVGTVFRAIFTRDDELYSYINSDELQGLNRTSPAIADLDADGDYDLLVGNSDGDLYAFYNTGSSTDPLFGLATGHISLSEPAHYPSLADLDGDGDLDLAAGTTDGYINIFENFGDEEDPTWFFSYLIYTGEDDDRPVCLADIDDDGDYDLTVGDGDMAALYFYRNVGSQEGEIWFADTTMYTGVTPEYGTSPAVADLNGDGRPDLAVGGNSGRIFRYKNSGSASVPQWLIWSSYQAAEGYMYYPKDEFLTYRRGHHQDRFADLILNAPARYKDEIAFSIAHMPVDNLRSMSQNQTLIFRDNAELIYEIDSHLDYVEVIEKGDYTTTRYEFGEPGSTVTRELPRDIYYWYVVHPKITDENVYYIDPNDSDPQNPTDPADGGRFWREYLFYQADDAYPPDNSGSPSDGVDDYPQDSSPPLLKEILNGITSLWNGTSMFAPGGRSEDYGDNAIIRVSNWVGLTLILNQQEVSDDERPVQPVRIAHHHNGNCGELQDLSTAAARTALIPAAGVLLLGEDHVWMEFYENGWHQWDNYWSHGGSVIDNFDNYWVGWGERGGSGIHKHSGDDDAWEVTDQYIPEEDLNHVTVRIMDNNGDPVDGARVLVISYWLKVNVEGYQVEIPFPCIWNYTDSNGETLFKLATQERANGNHNFTFKIISKVGSTESGKVELEHGQDYTFSFFLEGSSPDPELDDDPRQNPDPPDPQYKLGVNFQVVESYQRPRNLLTGHYHPEEIPPEKVPEAGAPDYSGNHVDSFITTGTEFAQFLKGYSFDSYEMRENTNSVSLEFIPTENEDWYFILSNRDSIETTKVVAIDLHLFFKAPPHTVKIIEPVDGAQLQLGGSIAVSGLITNETDLTSLQITTDGGTTWTAIGWTGNEWTYSWNTATLDLGMYTIEVSATFGTTQDVDAINVELVDSEPPAIEILQPQDGSAFNIGQTVTVSGTAADNIMVRDLEITTDGGNTWIDIISSLSGGHWSYSWDTSRHDPGEYSIMVQASDGSFCVMDFVHLELQDLDPPTLVFSTPADGARVNIGDTITVTGEGSDNRGIEALRLSVDGGDHWTDILSSLNDTLWSHEWNTSGLSPGLYILLVNGTDGTYNSSVSVSIELVDTDEPYTRITYPEDGERVDQGESIVIRGEAFDNVAIEELLLSTGGGKWVDVLYSLDDGHWYYAWDTTGENIGTVTIRIKASDGSFQASDSITLDLVDSEGPAVTISSPSHGEDFNCGDVVTFTGTATDNIGVEELSVSTDNGITWVDILPNLDEGIWLYQWDTAGLMENVYTLSVKASDGTNAPTVTEVDVDLKDMEAPVLTISSPGADTDYRAGAVIPILGTASDNAVISELAISTDDGVTWIAIEGSLRKGRWQYDWDTEGLHAGTYVILVRAGDGVNEAEESVVVVLTEETGEDVGELPINMIAFLILLVGIVFMVILTIIVVRRGRKKKGSGQYNETWYR